MPRPSLRSLVRLTTLGLLVAAVAYLALFKLGRVRPSPAALAALVSALGAALLAGFVLAASRAVRGPRRIAGAAEALAAAGLLTVAGGGLVNWALGVQGFVVLPEREPVRLSRTAELGAFEAGPLADRRELDVTMALARVQLVPAGRQGFSVRSQLRVMGADAKEVGLEIAPGLVARHGALVFRQGAFGFSPHVVVEREGRRVFDTFVPFNTFREGPDGIAFVGDFEITAERLRLRGAVNLDGLDERMKGHPRLELSVERDGKPLGSGSMKPGEVAEIGAGYRIGFLGLRRWSEIDFSRRTYPIPILAGLAAFAFGVALWPLASWRKW